MKKLLSVLVSASILLTLALPFSASASDSEAPKQSIVQYSVCDGGYFTLEPQELMVSADLSDKYAEYVGYNDSSENPTILDATIAAHIAMFGEDEWLGFFTIEDAGWAKITAAFGEETSDCGYNINGGFANGITDEVHNDDYIEFYFYQDAAYGDKYVTFDKRHVDAELDSVVTLTATYTDYDSNYNMVVLPAAGLEVASPDGSEIYGVTDENGQIRIYVDTAIRVTAFGTINSYPIFLPYCEINDVALLYEVGSKMHLATQYLEANGVTTNLNNAFDTYKLFRANAGDEKALITQLNENLAKNDNKIVLYDSENVVNYACIINMLGMIGEDYNSFNGVDFEALFRDCEDKTVSNPYYYCTVIEACTRIGDRELAKTYADELIKEYYVEGKGMNYWGFSCDNTAVFLTAISPLKREYADYVADALDVLKHYTTSDGCFYSDEFNDISPNSTATAMMAYASVGENDMAAMLLAKLYAVFEDSELAGVIDYYGTANVYATKDTVWALPYFDTTYYHCFKQTGTTKATCTKGNVAKFECEYCGYKASYTDSRAKGHTYKTTTTPATTSKSGSIVTKCSCGSVKSSKTINKIGTVTLGTTKYVYNGNAKKPTVTVKDSKGNKISTSYYSVTYTNNKSVGKATAKITFKGNYSGTVTKTFTIVPKGTTISSLSAASKGFTVKWKKQATQTTGYQIQYATDGKFTKGVKTVTVSKNSTVSKKITKLTGKKKYYVRVRTYKTVNGTKYYSSWSGYKTVTTKK